MDGYTLPASRSEPSTPSTAPTPSADLIMTFFKGVSFKGELLGFRGTFLGVGSTGYIYKIDENRVVKVAKNSYDAEIIAHEGQVYKLLGAHESIIKFLGDRDNESEGFVLELANEGHLADY
jgi:hypothetical protein